MKDKVKVRIKDSGKMAPVVSNNGKAKAPSQPAGFTPMAEPAKEVLKTVAAFARERLAKNIMPWNYDNLESGGKGTFKRGMEAIVLNKKEPERAEKEQYLEKGYGMKATDEDKLRLDLLSQYGGLKQKYNTLSASRFRPTKEIKKDTKYVDSKIISSGLVKSIADDIGALPAIRSKKDLENLVSTLKLQGSTFLSRDEKTGEVEVGKTGGVKGKITGLGTANIAVSEDEKGPYISYYDVWDIDPTSGSYKTTEQGTAKKAAIDFGKKILAVGSKPPEIYGRIYFDKKTGKPIL